MKVLMIYPEFPDTFWSFKHALPFQGKRSAYPPLGLLTVAAMLPASWQKHAVDLNVRPLKDSELAWADVVFLSGMMVQGPSMKKVITRAKHRGIRTVVGGPIASTKDPNIAEADHIVEGEAEELVAILAKDLETGSALQSPRPARSDAGARTGTQASGPAKVQLHGGAIFAWVPLHLRVL